MKVFREFVETVVFWMFFVLTSAFYIAAPLAPVVSVVFLILKACGLVAFSWFWVFFPLVVLLGGAALWGGLAILVDRFCD